MLSVLLGPSRYFMPLNQKTKKEITVLATLIDLEYQGKLDDYSVMEIRKNISGIHEVPYGVS